MLGAGGRMIGDILRDQRGHVVGDARPPIAAPTLRKDAWWLQPAIVVLVLGSFIVYSTWAAFQNAHYFAPPYLSPFYSPCLSARCLHVTFGYGLPDISLPIIGVLSPAFLILWGPGLFRLTCYYYRKAYYRFYFADPPGCAVGEPTIHRRFALENALPFVLQNLHRYLLYLAFIPLTFLWLDLLPAFNIVPDRDVANPAFRIGLGGVLFLVNVVLLTGYSLSCHSLRHLVGGRVDCFSCTRARRVRYTLWQRLTDLNRNHMWWAWSSLITVTLADVYVRLLEAGVLADPALRIGG
jgi:hypothetical protein